MFEVQDLRYATLATVSRCGMVWFSEDIVSTEMIFDNFLSELKAKPIEEIEEDITLRKQSRKTEENVLSPAMQARLTAFIIMFFMFSFVFDVWIKVFFPFLILECLENRNLAE